MSLTDHAPRGLTVLGSAAGSGKTGLSMGVLRHLSMSGVDCQPMKAVAVVSPDDPAYLAVQPWQRGVLHNCNAAGVPVRWWNNPVVVDLPYPGAPAGDLYIRGEHAGTAAGAGEDCLDVGALPEHLRKRCEQAVLDGFAHLQAEGHWIVVEGAGGAGELEHADDLANQVLPAHAGFPVVLVTNPLRSGHLAALAGLPAMFVPTLRDLVIGFVLNQIGGSVRVPAVADRMSRITGLPMLAAVDYSPQPDDYDGSPEALEAVYTRRRAYIEKSGLFERIPLPHAPSTALRSAAGVR